MQCCVLISMDDSITRGREGCGKDRPREPGGHHSNTADHQSLQQQPKYVAITLYICGIIDYFTLCKMLLFL